MKPTQKQVWACRGVAFFVLFMLTFLESLFILLLFAPIDLFTIPGLLSLLRVFVIAAPFNAAVFLFSTRYQVVKGRTSGVCDGVCMREIFYEDHK